eukprot:TRINITY_DN10759_c0_g1_i1.p2 TRINITY_DN10759_c0_g1~~TRINITY_DN10759_c0_g1_i1.p2  ORF type:complete len:104 (+),score=12.24 TRINITY_DN10759_c0_g1_i1:291-602(+)
MPPETRSENVLRPTIIAPRGAAPMIAGGAMATAGAALLLFRLRLLLVLRFLLPFFFFFLSLELSLLLLLLRFLPASLSAGQSLAQDSRDSHCSELCPWPSLCS